MSFDYLALTPSRFSKALRDLEVRTSEALRDNLTNRSRNHAT